MLEDLLDACRRNDLERVPTLVTADPTLLTRQAATGETPLLTAHVRRSGVSVSLLGDQHWHRGAAGGPLETAELLLAHRADPRRIARNVMANTSLHAAPTAMRLVWLELLPDCGDDPAPESTGRAPMASWPGKSGAAAQFRPRARGQVAAQ
jgi:hypothetical protein